MRHDETKIQPLNNNVLIRLIMPEETVCGGKLIKPQTMQHEESFQCPIGKVIACGPGARATKTGVRIPMDLKAGQTVYLRKSWPEKVNVFDDTLVMIDAGMVMATAENGVVD